jgi:predicted NBD/HSP70 family sugar kinase
MPMTKPSLELLRELSDQHVLRALMSEPRLTRAEIASRTELSKPTVGESVRRLVEAGILVDSGERTTGRGRVGSYFALADDVGYALAVSIAPEGIAAELIDAHGTVVAASSAAVARPARPTKVATSLVNVCRRVQHDTVARTRVAVVSAADPVDRRTGRLVRLPDAPFLLGELSPVKELAPLVDGPITVDNDVNWAARAERAAATLGSMDDFVYLYLGEGLGCAVVADGEVRRGHYGLAGEIAHVITTGPNGRACTLTEVFGRLGLRHEKSTAIDVAALTAAVEGNTTRSRRVSSTIGQAIAGVVSAAVAMTDPATIVLGGPWGTHPDILKSVRDHAATLSRRPTLRPASVTAQAPLRGARAEAIAALRRSITQYREAANA